MIHTAEEKKRAINFIAVRLRISKYAAEQIYEAVMRKRGLLS